MRLRSIARVRTEQRLDTSSAKPKPRNGESTQTAKGANEMGALFPGSARSIKPTEATAPATRRNKAALEINVGERGGSRGDKESWAAILVPIGSPGP
jgi:hypothetical protein